MRDDEPPIGLSEDEAYDTPKWVIASVAVASIMAVGMTAMVVSLGIAVAIDGTTASRIWAFWGSTKLLGGLLVASGAALVLGLVMLFRRNDIGLALLLIGVLIFQLVMFRAVLTEPDAGTRGFFFLVMLLPFLMLLLFQLEGVRTWFLVRGQDDIDDTDDA